jgi:hypothetical protein
LVLVLGVAIDGTCTCAECATDSSTFESVAGLVTEDATCCSAEKCATESTALGVRTGWGCAVAESDAGDSCDHEKG